MITNSAGVTWITKDDVEPHIHMLPLQWRARVREHRSYSDAALDRTGLRGTEEEHRVSLVSVELPGIVEGDEKTPSIGLSYTEDGEIYWAAWAYGRIRKGSTGWGIAEAIDLAIPGVYRLLAKEATQEARWRKAVRLYLMCSPNAVDRHRFEGKMLDHHEHWTIRQLGDSGLEAWCLAYLGRPSANVICSKCEGLGTGDYWNDPGDFMPVCPACKGPGVVPMAEG